MTWVKICGIQDADALDAAIAAGADAVGFVFARESRRRIPPDQACELARRVHGAALRVGVFVEGSVADVEALLDLVELDALQWSGPEAPRGASGTFGGMKQIRSVHLAPGDPWPRRLPPAWAYLADAAAPGRHGGTGVRADWQAAARGARRLPVILAGGLNLENVEQALDEVRPFGLDVSSGVERNGRKDPDLILSFVRAVRSHDA